MPTPPSFPKTEISRAIAPEGVDAIQFDSPFAFKNIAIRDAAYLALTSSAPTLTHNIATSEIADAGATFEALPTLGAINIGQLLRLADGTLWRLADALGNATPSSKRIIPDDYDADDNDVAWELAGMSLSGLAVDSASAINIETEAAFNLSVEESCNIVAPAFHFYGATSAVTFHIDDSGHTISLNGNTGGTQILLDDSEQTIVFSAASGLFFNGNELLVTNGDGSALTGITLANLGFDADGSSGSLLMTDGNGGGLVGLTYSQLGTAPVALGGTGATTVAGARTNLGVEYALIVFQETIASGYRGGAFTANARNKIVLSHKLIDTSSFVAFSDANDNWTLPAGTYVVRARAQFMDTGTTLMILRNSTDSTDVVAACHYVCSSPETGGWVEFESAEFTIAGTKTFELQVVPQNAGYHSYVSGALTLPSPAPTIQRVQIHIEHRA